MTNHIFTELFGTNWNAGIDPEDREKAQALLAVACKSSASLADVNKLAEVLGLRLRLSVQSEPKKKERAA